MSRKRESSGTRFSQPSCSQRGLRWLQEKDTICQHHGKIPEVDLGSPENCSVTGGAKGRPEDVVRGIEGLARETVPCLPSATPRTAAALSGQGPEAGLPSLQDGRGSPARQSRLHAVACPRSIPQGLRQTQAGKLKW